MPDSNRDIQGNESNKPNESSEPARGNWIELAPGVFAPPSVLRYSYSRSSGPGGQNVNKLSTKARLHVSLDELASLTSETVIQRLMSVAGVTVNRDDDLVIACDSSRSQIANRHECLSRLRAYLIQAMTVPKARKRRRPSAAMKRRRVEAKKRRAQTKRLRGKPSMDD